MSSKVMALSGLGLLALAVVLSSGSLPGCGSSSGSGNFQAVCDQGCDKAAMCSTAVSATQCKQGCTMQCSNASAMASKGQQCLAMSDCTAFLACVLTVPDCQSTAGTGGSSGAGTGGSSGGTGAGGTVGTGAGGTVGTGAGGTVGTGAGGTVGTGAGGSSGTGCSACAKVDACCLALGQPAAMCNSNTQCLALPSANQATAAAICQAGLAGLAGPNTPAACQP